MKLVLAGGSGFLGTAWRDHLAREGHEVVRLVRGEALSASESHWDPYAGQVDRAVDRVRRRRRQPVRRAARALAVDGVLQAHLHRQPGRDHPHPRRGGRRRRTASRRSSPRTASPGTATGATHVLTEESPIDADTFMGGVTRAWEAATDAGRRGRRPGRGDAHRRRAGPARRRRSSRCCRSSRPGSAARSGRARSTSPRSRCTTGSAPRRHLADRRRAPRAPTTSSGPDATTNADFGRELGRLLHRPPCVPVPAVGRSRLAGDGRPPSCSTRPGWSRPGCSAEGFVFEHPTLDDRLAAALSLGRLTGRDRGHPPAPPRPATQRQHAGCSAASRGSGTRVAPATATAPTSRSVDAEPQPLARRWRAPRGEHLRPHAGHA